MVVQHNLTAMNSNRMLGITTGSQAKSTEKLSSGYKINRAADDAAGLSISEKMRKQIRGLTQASLNAQDGISAVQTAEGALNEVQDMLQRMNELAVKAANGTMSENDRSYIQDEIDQLVTEIDRVSTTTKFNETYLLKGGEGETNEFGYVKTEAGIGAADGKTIYDANGNKLTNVAEKDAAAAVAANKYYTAIKGKDAAAANDDLSDYVAWDAGTSTMSYKAGKVLYNANGNKIEESDLKNLFNTGTTGDETKVKDADTVYTGIEVDAAKKATAADFKEVAESVAKLYDKDGNEVAEDKLADYLNEDGTIKEDLYTKNDKTTKLAAGDVDQYIKTTTKTEALTLKLHVGADNTADNQITVDIDAMSAKGLNLVNDDDKLLVNGKDDTNALAAIKTIEAAIQQVSKQRSALGAVQNRLEHTINNLDNVVENTTSAESQIRDTDMATEMVKYSNNNILAQAGQSMLAQANQSNQGVLSLLG